jgi:maltooligosyltrehalose trehalohydrolase
VPDPQARETFEASRLPWDELEQPAHLDLLAWYRQLIAARRTLPGLRDGRRPTVHWEAGSAAFLVERTGVTIAVNLGREPARLSPTRGETEILLASASGITVEESGSLTLPPMSVAILGGAQQGLTPASALTYGDET